MNEHCPTCGGWMSIVVRVEKITTSKGKIIENNVYGKCPDCTDGRKKN